MRANAHAVPMPITLGSARPRLEFSFPTLTLDRASRMGTRGLTFLLSLLAHVALVAAMVVVPLFMVDVLPTPFDAVHAFFVAPPELMAAPPPPPPPAPAATRGVVKAPPAPRVTESPKFVAPTVVPTELPPAEEGLDLGFEGGVPGGVEGGVPGGVLGGIVGGIPLPQPTPTPVAPRVVRIGGQLVAPALVRKVAPLYPELARNARVQGIVILEAQVATDGRVKAVSVLRGHPLLDDSAVEALKQWRYRPLLLNGVPTEFILTVTITFGLR